MRTLDKYQELSIGNLNENKIIAACPGAGKTTVMVEYYLRLVQSGISPKQILVVTFSRRAAVEICQRITRKINIPDEAISQICTIHAFCYRSLKSYWASKNIPIREVWNRNKHLGKVQNPDFQVDTIAKEISDKSLAIAKPDLNIYIEMRLKGTTRDKMSNKIGHDIATKLESGFMKYLSYINENNLITTDLMPWMMLQKLQLPGFRVPIQASLKHVILDECQDTSLVSMQVIGIISQEITYRLEVKHG